MSAKGWDMGFMKRQLELCIALQDASMAEFWRAHIERAMLDTGEVPHTIIEVRYALKTK